MKFDTGKILTSILFLALTTQAQAASERIDLSKIKLPDNQQFVRPTESCSTQDGKSGYVSDGEKGRRCEVIVKLKDKLQVQTQ